MSSQPIKLIVGLGNPGSDYEGTRHNTGFWFVDLLAQRYNSPLKSESRHHGMACRINVNGHDCRLLKPSTFMNRSGQAVSSLANYFKIQPHEILVAHDELDLPAGKIRLKTGGGHAGHNGLRDIMSAIGSKDFHRLRIGIDHPNDRREVVNYVLGRPSKADREAIDDSLDQAADCLTDILNGELQKAMNRLHSSRQIPSRPIN
ncbi:MAG: aminoacyl-tRNA hydrolase [endosymbiont of Seepiophila jonesi]|uniref:Peptidyl-tRNA hydrolase n=1 Tax=endosymbiont of Lamellibrachia luymesi TaxID=2200907 RepID=A0A370DTX1_9GAMM|nr:MAG: aminoacyl-tRNA hydrolase [endosymbiont of Lamellibrachia luymesi]RDH93582.1 MAG: aminoacyl-tRNA hydrolase [endosymbiont of Seepiophila jonesi]